MSTKFEDYLADNIEAIAETGRERDPEFHDKLMAYLEMIKAGIRPTVAKRVMTTLYM